MAQSAAAKARRRLGQYRVRARRRLATGRRPGVAVPGVVEHLDGRSITGWIEVPKGAPTVRVGLYIGEFEATTVATVPMEGRRSDAEIRSFRFPLFDFWNYTRTTDRITVRVNGRLLPFAARGMYYRPRKDGAQPLARLRRKLDDGWVFASNGRLLLSKRRDTEWQAAVMSLYAGVHAAVKEAKGYDPFFIYGSLLGAVRDNNFIGHDFDFDCAYVSSLRRGEDVAREAAEVARVLVDKGLRVETRVVTLHIYRPENPKVRIDLFHLYFDDSDALRFSWGVAGEPDFTREMWQGVRELPFAGSVGRIPINAEALVETMYGASWRTPDAGFTWTGNRRKQAREARIPGPLCDQVNWESYYAGAARSGPSSFADILTGQPGLPATVLDLGCGDGRDTLAFARTGRRAVGVDASEYAAAAATDQAAALPAPARPRFLRLDLGDAAALRAAIDELRADGGEPILFYGRFLLHALRPHTEATLLATIADAARAGDVLALEFRTLEDQELPKNRTLPYRRFIDLPAVQADLAGRGFAIVEVKDGTGLSPEGAEDPHLGRIIARFE
jgi:hypothetical protein